MWYWDWALLISGDVLLAFVGLKILRSRHAESVEGIPIPVAILLFCVALLVHGLCAAPVVWHSYTPGALGAETDLRVSLLMTAPPGLIPVLIFAFIVVNAFASFTGRQMLGEVPSQEDYSKARRLAGQMRVEEAIREYRRIAALYPHDPEPMLHAASTLEAVGRPTEAETVLKSLLVQFKKDPVSWPRIAERLVRLYEYALPNPAAIEPLRQGIAERTRKVEQVTPKEARKVAVEGWQHRLEANRKETAGDLEGAVETLRRQFWDRPHTPRPLFAAAALFERARRFDEAIGMLREAVNHFREDSDIWCDAVYRMATIHETGFNDQETARGLYRQVIKRQPDSRIARQAREQLDRMEKEPEP